MTVAAGDAAEEGEGLERSRSRVEVVEEEEEVAAWRRKDLKEGQRRTLVGR